MRNTPLILPLGVKNGTSNNGCLTADVNSTNLVLQIYYFVKINIFHRTPIIWILSVSEYCKYKFFQDYNNTKNINNTKEIFDSGYTFCILTKLNFDLETYYSEII